MHRARKQRRVQIWGLGIAVVAIATAGAISGSCVFGTRTTSCDQYHIHCAEGKECAADQAACIDIDGCGNGIIDKNKDEVCDDGNIMDGDSCSADCKSDETCGNGILDTAAGEHCDDHNTIARDGCSPDCQVESKICGNGLIDKETDEICDDGNQAPGDGCSPDCKSNEACGNGIVDNYGPSSPIHEDCDPKNLFPLSAKDTETCDSDCTFPRCGDGHTNTEYLVADSSGSMTSHPEECDDGGDSQGCDGDCTFVKCGDGYVNMVTGEDCEPDKDAFDIRLDTSRCDSDCTFPRCGDKHINPNFVPDPATGPEACDTGDDTLTCDRDCTLPVCGDGHINKQYIVPDSKNGHPEECDGGSIVNGKVTPRDSETCDDDCTAVVCGDEHINRTAGETCEDGNHNNHDSCPDDNGTCQMARCGDGFVWDGHEECDSGDENSDTKSDACRMACKNPSCGDGVIDRGHGEVCDKGGSGKPQIGCEGTTGQCNSTCTKCG